jgi:hypothetical protein
MRTTPRVAGFRSEYPAGFELECMAGFVGIRNRDREPQSLRHSHGRRPRVSVRRGRISSAM